MKKQCQKKLNHECLNLTQEINEMIDEKLPLDFFCSTKRDQILQDIESNLLIKYSPSMVLVVEYHTKSYLFVSENIKQELDISSDELMQYGIARALLNFEENHKNIFLQELYPLIFETYAKYAKTNEAKDLLITYNTLLKNSSGEYKWYYHQLAVLACDEQGFPRYAIKYLSNIEDYKNDNILNFNIYKKGKDKKTELICSKKYLPYEVNSSLSEREKEIMQLVKNGYSTKMIADKLFISMNTVSTHRKNVLRKLKETGIGSAIL